VCGATSTAADEESHEPSGLRFEVAEPVGWGGRDPVDLLVCLHGSGDSTEHFQRGLAVLAPDLRRHLRVFVASPDAQGWPLEVHDGVAGVARAVRDRYRVRRVVLFGYSAGGVMAQECQFQHAELFGGTVVAGAGLHRMPPADHLTRSRYMAWAIGAEDLPAQQDGVGRMRRGLESAGWDESHYRFDVLEGRGHELDGESIGAAVTWVLERLAESDDLSATDEEGLAALDAALEDEDYAAAREAADALILAGGFTARRALYPLAATLAADRDAPASSLGIELLGRIGDPRGAEVIDDRLRHLRRHPDRYVAAIEALGRIDADAAREALSPLLRKWEDDGLPQVAAAHGLARIGGRDEEWHLLRALDKAEDRRRHAYAEALNAALQAVVGHEIEGYRMWRAWHDRYR